VGRPTVSQGCSSNCGQPSCPTDCTSTPPPCDTCSPPPSCNENCGRRSKGSGQFSFTANLSASANASSAASSVSSAFAASSAYGLAGANNGSAFVGSGGSNFYVDYNTGYIPNLYVEEAAAAATASVTVPYSASRSIIKIVAIQAVCVDDKAVPHPASQVTPDKDIADAYEGELFRCIAGSRMQFTLADYSGKVDFNQGQTTTCDKGSALYHQAGGKVECRKEKPSRDCNERSLLRRYGAGIKIVKIVWTETYTAYRTETQTVSAQASAQATAMGMAIDGGVGGIVH
jgi:hypothetical protein